MFTVHVRGQNPKQTVRAVQMLSTAGYSPKRMALGDVTYVVASRDDLDKFRGVRVPAEVRIDEAESDDES